MSILTGVIAFPPDAPKDWGYGPSIKFKAKPANGGDLVVLFCSESHDDAAKLAKGVTVFYQMDGDKAKFMGVDQAQASKVTPAPASPAKAPQAQAAKPKLSQYVQLFASVTAEMEACELGAEPDNFWLNVRTVFIQAAKDGILPPVGFKANARIPHGPVEVSEKSEDDLPF